MKYRFVLADELVVVPSTYDGYSGDPEDQASFVPDIQIWIDEYMPGNRTSLFYYDAIEFEQGSSSFWMVIFRTEADQMLFKLQWTDDPRFVKFRKAREEAKRWREEAKTFRKTY